MSVGGGVVILFRCRADCTTNLLLPLLGSAGVGRGVTGLPGFAVP